MKAFRFTGGSPSAPAFNSTLFRYLLITAVSEKLRVVLFKDLEAFLADFDRVLDILV